MVHRWFGELFEKCKVLDCAPILTRMGERCPRPDATTYDVVIRGLCSEGKLDMVLYLVGQMSRCGVCVPPALREFLNEALANLQSMRDFYRRSGPSGFGTPSNARTCISLIRGEETNPSRNCRFSRKDEVMQLRTQISRSKKSH